MGVRLAVCDGKLEFEMKRILLAASLMSGAMVSASAEPAVRAPSWTGFYLGANLGWGWQNANSTTGANADFPFFSANSTLLQDGVIPTYTSWKGDGFLGGVTLGYTFQAGSFVYGIEADRMWTSIRGTSSEIRDPGSVGWLATTATETKTDWLATLRGRVGVLASPLMQIYATGGLAIGHVEGSRSTFTSGAGNCDSLHMVNFVCAAGSASDTKRGWTVGAGADYRIAQNWTVRAEYLYYDLGNISFVTNGTTPVFPIGEPRFHVDTKIAGSIVRIGLNYQFGSTP